MSQRNYSNNAIQTTLASPATASATAIVVTATTGFPAAPFVLALDFGAAEQELVLVSNVAGTTLTVSRGFDNTTAQIHSAGAVVAHTHAAIDFKDAGDHIAASTGVHGITGALVGTTQAQTLTNKVVALGSNTLSGTLDQFNTALTGADFASLAGAETLTNKTVALGSNTVSGTTAQFNAALSDGDFATVDGTETLTNKDLSSSTNTFPSYLDGDSGWVAVTPVAGFTGTIRIRRIGKVVTVQADGSFTTTSGASASLSLTSVAAAYRPSLQARAGGYFAGFAGIVTMSTGGDLSCIQNTGASRSSVSSTFSYMVD